MLEILNTLLLKPIEIFFEIVFMIAYDVTDNPGISIIILSLVMNFLLLPLYNRADKIQEEEKEIENRLRDGVKHIKKTFYGDERMLLMQTYYRQNHYKPTYVLRGAISLLLEIPFFMAAYAFLSNLELLNGISFGFIRDLGQADALFVVSGFTINILPILMTFINIVASLMYTKGSPIRAKIQLYMMALIFLVILYQAPAGLVLYWTMNNLFSLIKTIINKCPNPIAVLNILSSITGILLVIMGLFFYPASILKVQFFICILGLIFQLPFVYSMVKKYIKHKTVTKDYKANKKAFVAGCIFMTILTGILIPSAVISASPQEFVDLHLFYHPLRYIFISFCLAMGSFIIWAVVFYSLAQNRIKVIFENAIIIISFVAITDYMFFGKNMGLLNKSLSFEDGLVFESKEIWMNISLLLILFLVLLYILTRYKLQLVRLISLASIVLLCMSVFNMTDIYSSVEKVIVNQKDTKADHISFDLSTTEKNVVVIMLDRAFGGYVPYLMNEKPELKELFDGFTYYSNVISYGAHSNFGTPALFGGYEYTPLEINKRSDELLVDKHNEALKLMPSIFSENGFEVTISDPSYANYQQIPDLSIFEDIPNSKSFITMGQFVDPAAKKQIIINNNRNFFCYGIMKSLPLCVQNTLYQDGTYRQANYMGDGYVEQKIDSLYVAEGIEEEFMASYNVLKNLVDITVLGKNQPGQFIMFENNTTHDPMILQEPAYEPAKKVDNREYENANSDRFNLAGRKMKMENLDQIMHYQANMAAFLKLGEWFEYLRENGVYDHTRIILVADHGSDFGHFEELLIDDIGDVEYFYPLLMMKDYNATGFTVSDEFMTHADVPTMAMKDVIQNPVNPFTGKEINSDYKLNPKQYISGSHKFDVRVNSGNTFLPSVWYSVHDNIWNQENWAVVEEKEILP